MGWRCEHGLHAYRHVAIFRHRWLGISGECPTWTHHRRCKRCKFERSFVVFRHPLIRAYKW